MRVGAAALTGGGGGGGATLGIEPTMPPTTPLDGGGSSSSRIMAMSFGTAFGAIKRPASNWRGITLTILTGTAAGGGGGGGGGGGATRNPVSCVRGNASK